MDVDDDVYDDDEGRCFKSKPAALRHAAHIFFVLLLLVVEWYSFVSMLRFVRSAYECARRSIEESCYKWSEQKMLEFNTRDLSRDLFHHLTQ